MIGLAVAAKKLIRQNACAILNTINSEWIVRNHDVKKVLKVFLVILIVIIVLIILALFGLKKLWENILTAPMAPEHYTAETKTGGGIEAKYLAMGSHAVKCMEVDFPDNADIRKISIWYPAELETDSKQYPAVLFVNGTGVGASRYVPVFEHLASWGFIAIGNEDPSTWEGKKADATLVYLLSANEEETSVFYHQVDIDHIGVIGHSQGGVGVYNTINITAHKDLYQCAVTLSPTEEEMAQAIHIPYDPAKAAVPILMLSGSNNDVIAPDKMKESYGKVVCPKAMAVRKDAAHGEMLYCADGYATAWFMWHLQGDTYAAQAFIGDNPELLSNPLYQDQAVSIPE